MKKHFTILIFMFCLFQQTELSELLKLKSFVTHFIAHKKADAQLTVFRFIDMHYLDNEGNDHDEEEDNKLPFKTHDCTHHLTTPFSVQPPFVFTVKEFQQFPGLKNNFKLMKQPEIPSSFLADIWQPPKAIC